METEHLQAATKDKVDETHSGRWIRDQLREVADSGLAELERSSAARDSVEPEAVRGVDGSDQAILENLAKSISSAVVGPMRSLERNRQTYQRQTELAITSLTKRLEESQAKLATLEQALTRAEQRANDALAQVRELRPGVDQNRTRIAAAELGLRKDLTTLTESLEAASAQIGPLAARLAPLEHAQERHGRALETLTELEMRRHEASRTLLASYDELRESLEGLTDVAIVTEEPAEPVFDDIEPHEH